MQKQGPRGPFSSRIILPEKRSPPYRPCSCCIDASGANSSSSNNTGSCSVPDAANASHGALLPASSTTVSSRHAASLSPRILSPTGYAANDSYSNGCSTTKCQQIYFRALGCGSKSYFSEAIRPTRKPRRPYASPCGGKCRRSTIYTRARSQFASSHSQAPLARCIAHHQAPSRGCSGGTSWG